MKWNKATIVGLVFMLPLAAVLVWFGLYEYSVKQVEAYIKESTSDLSNQGYAISYDNLSISGTFFQTTATFGNPKVIHEETLSKISSSKLDISIEPWNFKNITFAFGDGTKLTSSEPKFLDVNQLNFENVTGVLSLDDTYKPKGLELKIEKLRPVILGKKAPLSFIFIDLKMNNVVDILNSGGTLAFQLSGMHSLLSTEDFKDPAQFNIVYSTKGLSKGAKVSNLTEWRDAGGKLELKELNINWLSLILKSKGTLNLDTKMRLQGKLETTFAGYGDILELFVNAGYIKEQAAKNVEYILTVIAGQEELGKKEIPVPLTLKKGYLKIGPFKFLKLYPLVTNPS